jgi:hypothetical protein
MTQPITFVPHPRLEYTEHLNRVREDYMLFMLRNQRMAQEYEHKVLHEFQESVRIERNREHKETVEALNLYNVQGRVKEQRDYKYAYWVGTLVDQYI